MSLDWNMTRVADYEALNGDTQEWPISEAVIFGTMAVDLGEITLANVDEWLFRMAVLEKLGHHWLSRMEGGKLVRYMPDRAAILRRVGLRTNVISTSRAAFMKKAVAIITEDVRRKLAREAIARVEAEEKQSGTASQ